jgi:hypothetical protein
MKKLLAAAVAVAVTSFSSFAMADGLEVGTKVPAFYVNDVTGPSAGEKLCYRCQYGNRPTVSIFTRDVNADVESLIQQIDGVVGQNEGKDMKAFVVLLTDTPDDKAAALKQVAEGKQISRTPLTTFDGLAGPPNYKISQDADITVMMWVGGELKVNKVFKKDQLNKDVISQVVSQTNEILN